MFCSNKARSIVLGCEVFYVMMSFLRARDCEMSNKKANKQPTSYHALLLCWRRRRVVVTDLLQAGVQRYKEKNRVKCCVDSVNDGGKAS
jgi:hypothetical protein